MKNLIRAMMDLIADEVCGKTVDAAGYAFTDEELTELYKLSKSHDLAHLVGNALIKKGLIENGELKAKFQKQVMLAVYRYEKMNCELIRLRETLNGAKIPFIPLKGAVIRQYYPEPWMRTSCDIDILVHENDLEPAAAVIADRLGYKQGSRGPHDIGFFSESDIHLELHYSLIEEDYIGMGEPILKSVWKSASAVYGGFEYVLADEMFFYYHVAHMAKHFAIGGCGIRPFLDIWVQTHRISFDREKRDELLREGGLLTFANEAESLSEAWFDGGEYTDTGRMMEEYLLRGGVYGSMGNRVSVQQLKKGGKFRYLLSRIWLPYDALKYRYPSLEGKRYLLPVYEVRRWFDLIFGGSAGRSINELKLNSSTTAESQNNLRELLSKLGLEN